MRNRIFFSLACLLIGYLLLGISHIAFLPAWEGNDEASHYSYLQQIADTFSLPRPGSSRLSSDVENYSSVAPLPYDAGGTTYNSFFKKSFEDRKLAEDYFHQRPRVPRHFSEVKNYSHQSQHPPLYYLILSPVYLATTHLSLGVQLFVLRLISYMFAWCAIIIGLYATAKIHLNLKKDFFSWSIIGISIWPILFPAWFPEMARIGNDSLCALIMSSLWLTLIFTVHKGLSRKYSLFLGILLGFGCLTKAFFLPISFSLLLFLYINQLRYSNLSKKELYTNLLIIFLLLFFISGWWYFLNRYQFGVASGSIDLISLNQAGGLIKNLLERFSVKAWLRGHAAMVTTFAWSCTESWARPPSIFLLPMAFSAVFMAIGYILYISSRPHRYYEIACLPVWLAAPVLLGLSYHVLAVIALTGEGRGTGGYYLHFLVAPLGFALSMSLAFMWPRNCLRKLVETLIGYSALFSIALSWLQLLLFSGLAEKSNITKYYQLADGSSFPLGLFEAYARLRQIAFPDLGFAAWILGGLMVLVGLLLLRQIAFNYSH